MVGQDSLMVIIAQEPEADALLTRDPFALVVGMMLDQQYPMEHAFRGPHKILSRFGSFDAATIAGADPDKFIEACTTPPAIHRYGRSMAARVQELARHIVDEYDGDAAAIWEGVGSADLLMRRLRALPGFGEQKAKIFIALLAKQHDVKPRGWTKAAGDYARKGFRSVADVVDAESLAKVRAFKKEQKKAAAGS